MTLLNLPALWLAALLPLIVIMYLLKLRRVERQVSSVYLWRKMTRDVQANAPWQRLRRNLLLILQLLFLAALILSLARPAVPATGSVTAQSAIFIIDTSASMAATDMPPNRLETAKAEARRMISELPAASQVTIIAAGRSARAPASQTTDRRLALQAIESLQIEPGEADLSMALQLAGAIARRQADNQTVVLSDGNADLPLRLNLPGQLIYTPIGQKSENQAIGLLNLQSTPGRLSAFAQVINYGPQPAQRRLAFYADGSLVDAFDVNIPAFGQQAVLAEGLLTTTQVVEARLLESPAALDYLALDDQALAVQRANAPISITLLSPGNLFLETGLSLLPGVRLTRLAPGSSGGLPEAALTIIDGTLPVSVTLPRSGALWYIGPLQTTATFSVTGALTNPTARPADQDQPLLQYLSLDDVHILDAARIPLPGWGQPVIVTEDPHSAGESLPLLFVGEPAGRRTAVLAFDLRRSDLPLNVAFPLLLSNLVAWLAPGQSLPTQLAPGAPLIVPAELAGHGETAVRITPPSGPSVRLDGQGQPVVFNEINQLGLYQIDYGTGQPLYLAVNLFMPGESRIAPADNLPVTAGISAAPKAQEPAWRELWRGLALAALALLVIEWLITHRATLAMIFK